MRKRKITVFDVVSGTLLEKFWDPLSGRVSEMSGGQEETKWIHLRPEDEQQKPYIRDVDNLSGERLEELATRLKTNPDQFHTMQSVYLSKPGKKGDTDPRALIDEDKIIVFNEIMKDPATNTINPSDLADRANEAAEAKQLNLSFTKKEAEQYIRQHEQATTDKPENTVRLWEEEASYGPAGWPEAGAYALDLLIFKSAAASNKVNRVPQRYILTVMDLLSRKMYARPLSEKTVTQTNRALREILAEIQIDSEKEEHSFRKIKVLFSDNGSEFARLDTVLGNVKWVVSEPYVHEPLARLNRAHYTLRKQIGRMFTQKKTKRWVDMLPEIIENYNSHENASLTKAYSSRADKKVNDNSNNVTNRLAKEILDFDNRRRAVVKLLVDQWMKIHQIQEDPDGSGRILPRPDRKYLDPSTGNEVVIKGRLPLVHVRMERSKWWTKFTKASMHATWSKEAFALVKRRKYPVDRNGEEIKAADGTRLPSTQNVFYVQKIDSKNFDSGLDIKMGDGVMTVQDNNEREDDEEQYTDNKVTRDTKEYTLPSWWPFYQLNPIPWDRPEHPTIIQDEKDAVLVPEELVPSPQQQADDDEKRKESSQAAVDLSNMLVRSNRRGRAGKYSEIMDRVIPNKKNKKMRGDGINMYTIFPFE